MESSSEVERTITLSLLKAITGPSPPKDDTVHGRVK